MPKGIGYPNPGTEARKKRVYSNRRIKRVARNSNPSFSDDQGDDISLGDLTRKGVQYPSLTYDSLGGFTPRMAIRKAKEAGQSRKRKK